MKSWLKFIGLSFFSDKIAKQAVKRGYGNVVLGFIVSFAVLICGIIAGDLLPFSTHYSAAEDFRQFLYNAFTDGAEITIKDGVASSDKITDTFINGSDAEKYGVNGYNFVVDTRPSDALDDFIPYCLANDGTGDRITYEEYLNLSAAAKRNFDFKVEYTPRELELTAELTQKHESFLKELPAENTVSANYADLEKKKGELSESEYARGVYVLYVKAYYPSMTEYEQTGGVPLLRNYYYHSYSQKAGEKYFYIFSDSCTGCFKTSSGHTVQFYGFYDGMADGRVGATADGVDKFIKDGFYNTSGVTAYVYLMNFIRFVPYIVLVPVICALLLFCIMRLIKSESCKRYGGSLKIAASYLIFASLITALSTFICGYFVSRSVLFMVELVLFFVVLLVRSGVFVITEKLYLKKNPPANAEADAVVAAEVEDDTVRG